MTDYYTMVKLPREEDKVIYHDMTICICGSLSHYKKVVEVKKLLEQIGHRVLIPWGMEKIIAGQLTSDSVATFKERNQTHAIKRHYEKICASDAILVVNEEKNGIKHYIGGNTLMEMGFAFVLDKPIYLLSPVPEVPYKEEIIAMKPFVLGGDVGRITKN